MIHQIFVAGVALTLVAACSTSQYRWQNASGDQVDFEAAKQACKSLAAEHASEQNHYYDDHRFFHSIGLSTRHHGSFVGFGYGFGYDPYFDNRQEYYQVCMKAKGWERIKVVENQTKTTVK
ncbi:MAG: hypothetical protein OQJ91_15320 [Motiliproteus sp.]|nr:hypothetical protein [Motiliproteus sp.]